MPTIRVHFDGKVIVPDEPLDLQAGQAYIAHLEPVDHSTAKAGSAVDWLLENCVDDPSLPTDLSENIDHYLYGVPKRKP